MENKRQKEYKVALITYNATDDTTESTVLCTEFGAYNPDEAAYLCHGSVRKELPFVEQEMKTSSVFYIAVLNKDQTKNCYYKCVYNNPDYKEVKFNEKLSAKKSLLMTEKMLLIDILTELRETETGVIKKMTEQIKDLLA